jgi:hypothetical protein
MYQTSADSNRNLLDRQCLGAKSAANGLYCRMADIPQNGRQVLDSPGTRDLALQRLDLATRLLGPEASLNAVSTGRDANPGARCALTRATPLHCHFL